MSKACSLIFPCTATLSEDRRVLTFMSDRFKDLIVHQVHTTTPLTEEQIDEIKNAVHLYDGMMNTLLKQDLSFLPDTFFANCNMDLGRDHGTYTGTVPLHHVNGDIVLISVDTHETLSDRCRVGHGVDYETALADLKSQEATVVENSFTSGVEITCTAVGLDYATVEQSIRRQIAARGQ